MDGTIKTYLDAHDGFRLDEVGYIGVIVNAATLVSEAGPVPRTARDDMVFYGDIVALFGCDGFPCNMKRRNLEKTLHNGQDVGMKLEFIG